MSQHRAKCFCVYYHASFVHGVWVNTMIIPTSQIRKRRLRESAWLALGYTSRKYGSKLELRTSEARFRPLSFQLSSFLTEPSSPELFLIQKLTCIKGSIGKEVTVHRGLLLKLPLEPRWPLQYCLLLGAWGGNKINRWSQKPNFMRAEPVDQGTNPSLDTSRFLSLLSQTCTSRHCLVKQFTLHNEERVDVFINFSSLKNQQINAQRLEMT